LLSRREKIGYGRQERRKDCHVVSCCRYKFFVLTQ
jgi:hypothetical protein